MGFFGAVDQRGGRERENIAVTVRDCGTRPRLRVIEGRAH
jgi:hypothetical protein